MHFTVYCLSHFAGIAAQRMAFVINVCRPRSSFEMAVIENLLQSFGADYRIWIGEYSSSGAYKVRLEAISRVPIHDWVIMAHSNEFIDFDGKTAERFLSKCEREVWQDHRHLHHHLDCLLSYISILRTCHQALDDHTPQNPKLTPNPKESNNTIRLFLLPPSVAVMLQSIYIYMQGVNWVTGKVVHRVHASGRMQSLSSGHDQRTLPVPPVWKQYPFSCNLTSSPDDTIHETVVAFRGYLRPNANLQGIIRPEQAAAYLGGSWRSDCCRNNSISSDGDININSEKSTPPSGGDDLTSLAPYQQWWQFYRTPLMVGNAYLWSPRKAYSFITMYDFMVPLSLSSAAASSQSSGNSVHCLSERSPREVIEKGFLDERVLKALCRQQGRPPELPLSKDAALRVLAMLHNDTHRNRSEIIP